MKNAVGVICRKMENFSVGDSLYDATGLAEYVYYIVTEINPLGRGCVTFLNGETLLVGDVISDNSEDALQRVQIRQTIISHLSKERELYVRGIKCLSLFFIDEVSHYRQYDDEGNEAKGKFQKIFEEEYARIVDDFTFSDKPYDHYLLRFTPQQVHKGYFSIDNKTGRTINSAKKLGDVSKDISAFDLILRNKERLLSFDEPTRFIFSHSALREGWDNPNVFQICTLRHSNSTISKR